MQVPSIQLETNAPPMLRGGSVQQMQDVVTDDIKKLGAAQKQIGDLAIKLQEERDDAVYTQKHNEYITKVNETKLKYSSLEGINAVKQVGVDPDTDEPITVLDQQKAELSKLLEDFEGTLENDRQKFMFKTAAASTLNSASVAMTKHSIKEEQKYADAEFLNAIDLAADTTGQNYEDWHDLTGEFAKHGQVAILLANRYAFKKGWPAESSQRASLIQKVATKIHQSTLNQMIAAKDFDDAKLYLEKATEEGTVNATLFNTYSQKINTGYNKQNGERKANAILTNRGNTNSGDFVDRANKLFELDSFNTTNDGTGKTVNYGFRPDEVDTSDLTETDAKELLEQIQNSSKFYNPESNLRLLSQHATTHLFIAKHFGVNKADAYFTKAKSELEIDKTKYKENATYAKDINEKIIEKVIGYTNEEAIKKFGKDDSSYVDIIANDLQILKTDIDYEYNPANGITYVTDEKTGMPLLADLKKKLKNTIKNEDQLEYALAELEKNYNAEKEDKEEQYDALLEQDKEKAFAREDGWTDIEDLSIYTREDQRILKNGHPEESDTNTYAYLLDNPTEILPENLGKYRDKLSKSDYRKFLAEGQKLQGGGNADIIAVTSDVTMLKNTLNKYDMGKLHTSKNKQKKERYIAIQEAWKNEINAQQIIKGKKLTRAEKQTALNTVLLDNVNIDNDPFLGFIGGGDTKDKNIFFVDQDRLEDVYVDIPYKDENVRVFTSKIDDDVLELIQDSLRRANKPVTQKNIADYFVRKGQPKNVNEAFAYREEQ